ncbi:TIGR03564 family F420-dependent LLM class oxidoreductase [Streptomyces sp. NPDC048172]|uniref:TIGR03564 family F420-dependent LLM class oxidoreductase n=1 Tax=Streptomyces sp. NPDC048172 TaxID=3365505 RepID=UPI0037209C37
MRLGIHTMDTGLSAPEAAASVRRTVEGGFAHAWVNQGPTGHDPLSVLAAVGAAGPAGAELGTAIVPTYARHPVNLAASALTVHALTDGRLTLGIGPSHPGIVEGQWGIPYDAPVAHTREYLEILRPLLRGEAVEHRGERLTAVTRLDVPEAAPPPPGVLLSALGPRMLRLAGELADGTVVTWARPGLVARHLVPGVEAGAPPGTSPRVVVMALVAVTAEPDRVRDDLAEVFGGAGSMPAYRALLERDGLTNVAETAVVGSESEVLRQLARYGDAGTTDLIAVPTGDQPDATREVLAATATAAAGAAVAQP